MPGSGSKLTHYARWLFELLFSLYVSLFVVGRESSKESSKFIDWLAVPLVFFDRLLANWRHGFPWFPRGDAEYALDLGVTGLLTLILFVCLRLIDQIRFARILLNYAFVAVIAIAPLLTPVFEGRHLLANGDYEYSDAGHLYVSRWLQEVEVVLLLASLYSYLSRLLKWPAKMPALLFAAHFAFWGLIIVGPDWWELRDQTFVYLLLPFAASLVWALSRRSEDERPVATPAKRWPRS